MTLSTLHSRLKRLTTADGMPVKGHLMINDQMNFVFSLRQAAETVCGGSLAVTRVIGHSTS